MFVKLKAYKEEKEVFNKSYFLDEQGSGEDTAMGKLVSLTLSASIDLMIENKLPSGVLSAPHNHEIIDYYFSILNQNNIIIKTNI